MIKKNKTPKKEIKGYYISKKRVEKSQYDNYLNFNKHIQHQIIKNPIYIFYVILFIKYVSIIMLIIYITYHLLSLNILIMHH